MRAANILVFFGAICVALVFPAAAEGDTPSDSKPLRAVVLTGGHGYDKEAFEAMFRGVEGIEFVFQEQRDHSELFEDISGWDYDVIVFYSMTQEISEKRQQNLLALLDRGVGVVALHHIISGFNQWPEFQKIIGSRFLFAPVEQDGTTFPVSSYKHDITVNVTIADPAHPVTKGVTGFTAVDETYLGCMFQPDNQVLLTTDEPTSDKTIGWVRTYRKSRVCTIQLGHGPTIFADPMYKKLVMQAVRWTARKTG
ncbi:MAG TPA: ThuA domain-containing protein [Candidatus Hydrogenedentes bacterium]|jgi:hypothetical protein|nr:ThuA domain-containing protein [Candidatus Hydrogenedentota bacterium]HPJ99888.1 ThuA domain-containing protein [Candidatus Hydrogenedentota bacterium]